MDFMATSMAPGSDWPSGARMNLVESSAYFVKERSVFVLSSAGEVV